MLFVMIFTVSATVVCAKSPPTPGATEEDIRNRNAVAFPIWRMHLDWMYQDFGLDTAQCFSSSTTAEVEIGMVRKVLDELKVSGIPIDDAEKKLAALIESKKPGNDPVWKDFYVELCEQRRQCRLAIFEKYPRQFVYAKHHVFGDSQPQLCAMTHETDSEYQDKGPDYQMGAELCLLTIHPDGRVSNEVLYDCPTGVLRDPSVSFDAQSIAFSMRKNDIDDDFHLYVMNVADRSVRQITYGPGTCDMEPCYLPSGDIVFTSTRCVQSAGCWWTTVMNLYTCDGEGRYIRRIGFDQDHTIYPQLLSDGRIVYTRWEYNDRYSGTVQTTFMMNPDGTNQTEHYGNNSYWPLSLFHVRGIPGTDKSIGIISGHHVSQHGKLVMIDRSKGNQEDSGLTFLCPPKEAHFTRQPYGVLMRDGIEYLHYSGEQFQYPHALDEDHYIVSYIPHYRTPWGRGPYEDKFGIYWMANGGQRELLVYDPTISSGQLSPLAARERSSMKLSSVDPEQDHGTFYVQDVHFGASMAGIKRGTAKKLRVVGIEPRAVATTVIIHFPAGNQIVTPIAINNGSWDVKHVLGEVDVEDDGSAYFEVPARTPVYFQLLDEKGHTIQTMRTWTVLQPGETLACIGCHEDKNSSVITNSSVAQAVRKSPQKIRPFFKTDEEPVQEQFEFFSDRQRKAWEYLNIQAPQNEDVPRGFSYRREIQPIWDAHCISCHTGEKNTENPSAPFSLLGDSSPYDPKGDQFKGIQWIDADFGPGMLRQLMGRDFSESYLNLTKFGHAVQLLDLRINGPFQDKLDSLPKQLICSLHPAVGPELILPYSFGSHRSELLHYLEPTHYNVRLSQEEKDRVACWIDLCIPFCGSYLEANTWKGLQCDYMHRYSDCLREVYLYHEAKRLTRAEVEVDHLEKYKEHLRTGTLHQTEDFAQVEFGGTAIQKTFIEQLKVADEQVPIHGIATGLDSRGGTTVADNSVRNLALNPYATTHQVRSYPHATSNSHHKYRAENSPKNLIDGDKSDNGPCWRPDPRTDLWVNIDFGREVLVEKIVLYLRMLPGAKKTWSSATLVFSNGEKIPITLQATSEPQEFTFPVQTTRCVHLTDLSESFPLSENGIAEWEIIGRDRL